MASLLGQGITKLDVVGSECRGHACSADRVARGRGRKRIALRSRQADRAVEDDARKRVIRTKSRVAIGGIAGRKPRVSRQDAGKRISALH
jgi:hypothetical protein